MEYRDGSGVVLSVFVRYAPIIKLKCFIDKYVPVNYRIVLLFLCWHDFVAIIMKLLVPLLLYTAQFYHFSTSLGVHKSSQFGSS